VKRRTLGLGVWLAVGWLGLLAIVAALADVLPLADPADTHSGIPLSIPTSHNALGTDALGRDLLSRTIFGSRVSLLVGLSAVLVSSLVGGTLGVIAGFYRRKTELGLLLAADVLLAFPALLLAVSIVSFTQSRGPATVVLAIALIYLGPTIRIVRGLTLSVAQREHVLAARALGAKDRRIILREIVPNVLPTMLALAVVAVAGAMIAEGGLAYLNLSVAPPTPTWGGMMAAGKAKLDISLYPVTMPAVAMFLTVLSLTVIGDALQRRSSRQLGAI
jgi:peptide/nickel transport system permease protein